MRRQQRENAKVLSVLKKAGFPEFRHPLAPVRMTNLSDQEAANMAGVRIGALHQWKKEQEELIRKAAIAEAQEKLSETEEFITAANIITALKALEGFRYAKSAANHLLANYYETAMDYSPETLRKIYTELHDKWGIELVFDEPKLNELMGFDEVDWMHEYVNFRVPVPVFERIQEDSGNIQTVLTQLAVIWELCEEFGFARHKKGSGTMLDKFWSGLKEKYNTLAAMKHGISYGTKLLKEKYDFEVGWNESIKKTLSRWDV